MRSWAKSPLSCHSAPAAGVSQDGESREGDLHKVTFQVLAFEVATGPDCHRDTAQHSASPMDYRSLSNKKASWESPIAECLPGEGQAMGYISSNNWECIERNKKSDKERNLS